MKRILVPVDYSENAQNALAYAFEIARLAGAELMLLHVFFPSMSPSAAHNVTDVMEDMEEGKSRELLEFADQVRKILTIESEAPGRFDAVPVKVVAKLGGAYEKILETIERYDTDLVVMGMQGGEAVSQALLGSTTISVIQKSRVPVLAVPKGVDFNQFATIVFAIDLRKLNATTNLRFLSDVVQIFKANLQVLHVYRNETQQNTFDTTPPLQHLVDQFEHIPYTVNFDVQENVAAAIQQFIRAKRADLLVLIPQKHTILDRLLDKSITGKITARPLVPLLALPADTLLNQGNAQEPLVTHVPL